MSVETLFSAVLEQPAADRQRFLQEACGSDAALLQRLQALLAAHEKAVDAHEPPEAPVVTGGYVPNEAPAGERAGTVVAGRYKLLERIGEGGMGTVWVAEQTQPVRRKVAVKLIKAGMDSKTVLARFEAERQALALMDHPNIAKVLDGGTVGQAGKPDPASSGQAGKPDLQPGRPYFVMEYVKGVPITKYCDEARLSIAQRLALYVPVCQAVQHAHQKGIIHRDLKPSNVLVCLYDGVPVPKVIDFGLAKAMHQPLTEHTLHTAHGVMMGTPLYMSPEQAEFNNLDVDTRTDIYSLGVILYELLTGTTPLERQRFQKAAWHEMLRLIKEEEPPRPSVRLSGSGSLPSVAAQRQLEPVKLTRLLRGELDWIVMKCLEKDRSRRYETANGLARDMQRYLADEPVEAGPPSAGYRLRKLARKYRGALTTAATIALLLVVGVGVSTWQAVRATRAEALAVAERDAKEQARAAEAEQRAAALTQKERAEAAEAEARMQAKEANDKLALATAVTEFLQNDLLGQAGSRAQANRQFEPDYNLTIKEALDRAAAAVGNRFKGRPELEASIRQTMGDAYREVGNYEQAIAQLRQAAAIRKGKLDPDHPDVLTTLTSLALAFEAAGRTTEAIALHEQVRDTRVKKHGPDHADTLATSGNLANAYREAGRTTEAIALLKRVRDVQEKRFGADHASTLTTLSLLALAYGGVGNWTEAIALLEQVRVARAKQLGPHHPDTLETLANLADIQRLAGKTAEPIALLEQVRDARVKDLGPDHPDTLRTLNHLAAAYWQAKQLDQSIPLFEQTLAVMRQKLGDQHPQTLRTQANLGVNYRDAGRLAEAIPLLEQAHRQTGKQALLRWVGRRLATVYISAGRTAEGALLVKENIEAARKWYSVDSPPLATALDESGSAFLELQAWSDAEAVLRESLAIWVRKQPDAWTTFNTRAMLGRALLGQKKYVAAEPLLVQGYQGMTLRADMIPPIHEVRLTEALEGLVQLYAATGREEKAEEGRKKLDAVKAAKEEAPKK
jgi:serine/threonine protein kinase/tetratricopeptide (TPR) repeat protein